MTEWIAWATVLGVIVAAVTGAIELIHLHRNDERQNTIDNRDAITSALANARTEFDTDKAQLIAEKREALADRDYYRRLSDERLAEIRGLMERRQT